MKKNISLVIVLFSLNMFAMEVQKEATLRPALKTTFSVVRPGVARYNKKGTRLVVGSWNRKISVYDTADFSQPKSTITVPYGSKTLSINPLKENEIASGSPILTPVSFYDIVTSQNTGQLDATTAAAYSLQYSNNGSTILVASDNGCTIWDTNTKRIIKTIIDQKQSNIAQFDPTNSNLLASSVVATATQNEGCPISWWDLRNASKSLCSTKTEVPLFDINYDNEGKQLVCSASSQFIIYGANAALIAYYTKYGKKSADNKPVHIPTNKGIRYADSLQFMPGQSKAFVAGLDTGDLVVCDLENDKNSMHFTTLHDDYEDIFALAIHPSGKSMMSSYLGNNEAYIWDISAIKEKVKAKLADPSAVPVRANSRWCSLQ